MATMTIPGVEMMRTGHWDLSSGPADFSTQDLHDAVDASRCPGVSHPVVKLGHLDDRFDSGRNDGTPSFGKVVNMRVSDDGAALVGDMTQVPEWLASALSASYPSRSVEGQRGFTCELGHCHAFALTALALLGTTRPGIAGLNSIEDLQALLAAARGRRRENGKENAMRTNQEIIAAAVARGAITESRAGYWRAVAASGGDISILDECAGTGGEAVAAAGSGPVYRQTAAPGTDATLMSANPLFDEMSRTRPGLIQAALADDPNYPRLFGSTDLPLITASGMDPSVLASVPWPLRRPLAAMPTLSAAYNLLNKYSGEWDTAREMITDRANQDYLEDFSLWLQGPGTVDTTAATPASEQLHQETFGPNPDTLGNDVR